MNRIKVTLLHYTPLDVCVKAIRTCWNSFDKSDDMGRKDLNLIDRIGNKMKHESVKNHITFNFYIEGISTKTLLALTRHDVGVEFSVQSTRYTLGNMLTNESSFIVYDNEKNPIYDFKRASKYITLTGDKSTDIVLIKQLELTRELSASKKYKDNDNVAMTLTQAYKYNLTCSFSLTALQHFFDLRDTKEAHWDIRELANKLYVELPEETIYLFDK